MIKQQVTEEKYPFSETGSLNIVRENYSQLSIWRFCAILNLIKFLCNSN